MSLEKFNGFVFHGPRLDDFDFPRIGHQIGVGEDIVHAVIDTETGGSSTDSKGRIKCLYEPHVAFRNSHGETRDKLVAAGLAYKNWGEQKYPPDSYPRVERAAEIDETVSFLASSWAFPQILGENFALAGYDSPQEMVLDMLKNEDRQLQAMINFIRNSHLDDELRVLEQKLQLGQAVTPDDCRPFVRGYNGSRYAKHGYHIRFARNLNKWAKIPDTLWSPGTTEISAPVPRSKPKIDIHNGAVNDTVMSVQKKLDDLGYPEVGSFDGRWGTKTRAAVLAFRADNDLPLKAVIDDELLAVLMVAEPRPVSKDRAEASISDLRKEGASDVKAADATQLAGGLLTGGGVLTALNKATDQVDQYGGLVTKLTTTLQPLQQFVADNLWLLLAGAGGFVVYQTYRMKSIRLDKHRTGRDVSE